MKILQLNAPITKGMLKLNLKAADKKYLTSPEIIYYFIIIIKHHNNNLLSFGICEEDISKEEKQHDVNTITIISYERH